MGPSTTRISQAALVAAIVAAMAGGVFLIIQTSASRGSIEISLPTPTPASVAELKVYITGAVESPGVYAVDQGSRLAEAVEAAGGATQDADLTAVNLAVRVRDEQHWHIPRQGEPAPVEQSAERDSAGKIDLNSASVEELKALPGIGDVKAASIVAYRGANGAATLRAIRDLVEVR